MLQSRTVSADEHAAAAFPDQVGKYELLLPLGTGGMATVYLARSRGVAGFEREVALKLVHAHLRADEESRLHLLEEARLAARIRHPNVVPVTEVDSDTCGIFLVMEYVEGESLSGLVRILRDRNQRLPPRLVAAIMDGALAGLHAAHELASPAGDKLGLVHRDFSPQNILVGVEGVARLADFGVAKAASRTVRTKTGLVKGKIAYMSPEQARGHKVDRRCDVWAAGVVVWELITGRKLHDHEDDIATLLSVVTEKPPRLSDVMDGVPRALDDAVASALATEVDERCASAEAFRLRLEAAWKQCGGAATAGELGAFVKETVGDKLEQRRRSIASSKPIGPRPAVALPAPPQPIAAAPPPSSRAVLEEGTKTAISAAVPTADEVSLKQGRRVSRILLSVGAGAALVATGVFVSGLGADTREPSLAAGRSSASPGGARASGPSVPRSAAGPEPSTAGDGSRPAGSRSGLQASDRADLAERQGSPSAQGRGSAEGPEGEATENAAAGEGPSEPPAAASSHREARQLAKARRKAKAKAKRRTRRSRSASATRRKRAARSEGSHSSTAPSKQGNGSSPQASKREEERENAPEPAKSTSSPPAVILAPSPYSHGK